MGLKKLYYRQPSEERGCRGKTNLGEAYAQADKLAIKHGKRFGVYRCPHCGGTHLTTKLAKSAEYAPLLHITPDNKDVCGERSESTERSG